MDESNLKIYALSLTQAHKPTNIRELVISDNLTGYIGDLRFSGIFFENKGKSKDLTLIEKFNSAITALEEADANGNDLDKPFYKDIEKNSDEERRQSIITKMFEQEINPMESIEKIRFFMLVLKVEKATYRFFIKFLRQHEIKTRFVLSYFDKKFKIQDLQETTKCVPLPSTISYVEKIVGEEKVQYVFNVQDYEEIFALSELKVQKAVENFEQFINDKEDKPKFKIASDFELQIDKKYFAEIRRLLQEQRLLHNKLSRYKGEAGQFELNNIKEANAFAETFSQKPFIIDEETRRIIVTLDSFEAFVSVVTDTKKMGVASHKVTDSLGKKKK